MAKTPWNESPDWANSAYVFDYLIQKGKTPGNPYLAAMDASGDDQDPDTIRKMLALMAMYGNQDQKQTAFSNFLQYQKELEARDYNRQMQLDQREYDSAKSQIERLMATGMSRQAAIAALGGSSGSGSSSVPYTQAQSPELGLSPSETAVNEQNVESQKLNNIFNGINACANLIGSFTGIGSFVTGAISTAGNVALTAAQTVNQKNVSDGLSAAASLTAAIQPYIDDGSVKQDSLTNMSSIGQVVQANPNDQTLAQAYNKCLSTPLGRQYVQQGLSAEYSGLFNPELLQQSKLQTIASGLNNEELRKQILFIGEQTRHTSKAIDILDKQGNLLDAQAINTTQDTEYKQAMTAAVLLQQSLTKEEINSLRMQNEVYGAEMTYIQAADIARLQNETLVMAAMRDVHDRKEYLESLVESQNGDILLQKYLNLQLQIKSGILSDLQSDQYVGLAMLWDDLNMNGMLQSIYDGYEYDQNIAVSVLDCMQSGCRYRANKRINMHTKPRSKHTDTQGNKAFGIQYTTESYDLFPDRSH